MRVLFLHVRRTRVTRSGPRHGQPAQLAPVADAPAHQAANWANGQIPASKDTMKKPKTNSNAGAHMAPLTAEHTAAA